MTDFSRKAIRVGTLFLSAAVLLYFVPGIYLCITYGVWPSLTSILAVLASITSTAVSWIVQPISYFPSLGVAGTYMTWLAGSAADLRVPCSVACQQAVGVEQGSDDAEPVSTIGVCISIFVSFIVITILVLMGSSIVSLLPEAVKGSFAFIMPSLAGALYVSMITSYRNIGLTLLPLCYLCYILCKSGGVSNAVNMLIMVVLSFVITTIFFKRGEAKKAAAEK